jgi:outer membrane protein insertion porin family
MIRSLRILTLGFLFLVILNVVGNGQTNQTQPCPTLTRRTSTENMPLPCPSSDSQNRISIEFQGLNALTIADTLKSFREHALQLMLGDATPTEKNINEAAKLLKGQLADKGYMNASVVGLRIGDSNGVRFVVEEGMKYAITSLEFAGNKHFTRDDLAAKLREYLTEYENEMRSGYDRELLDYSLHQLASYVRSQGYLQAQLGEPRIDIVEGGLRVTIPITEGQLYRLGDLKFNGVQAMSVSEVRSLLPMTTGDIASGERIGEWLFEDLKRVYGEKGFIQYTAEPVPLFKNNPRNPEEGIVDFEIQIDEGKQFTLRSLTVEGASLSQKQLADFFVVKVGDFFNQRLLDESVQRINKADLFEVIDVDRDFTFKTDEENATVALVLNLRKRNVADVH